MEKKESIIGLGIKLLIITAVAGLVLGWVHSITAAPIEAQAQKTKNDAMKQIITKADSFKPVDVKVSGNILEVDEAKNGNDTIGYAIKVTSKGYSGPIEMIVGISNEGKLEGIKILSQTETPGLGANAPEPAFSGQYKDKAIEKDLEVVKGKASASNQIEAMTGATITSKAVTKGVNEAVSFYKENLKGGVK